ncbi:hypothetical protein WJX74_003821 [Apatococcus lobatus]|uniref:Uncharacterized protein n=1 Tax=Apatococcus lobatus TaxID=904363 RepID=A0AAW1SEW5_9CHLO
MTPLRATAPCFQPNPVSFDIFLDWQGRSSTTGKLVQMDRAFFNPYVQDAVRIGCLTAAPWLRATGLPRDTLGLLSVCQFYQELALEYLEREDLMGTLQQECAALRSERDSLKGSLALAEQSQAASIEEHQQLDSWADAPPHAHPGWMHMEASSPSHARSSSGLPARPCSNRKLKYGAPLSSSSGGTPWSSNSPCSSPVWAPAAGQRRQQVRRAARPFSLQDWTAQALRTQLLADARKQSWTKRRVGPDQSSCQHVSSRHCGDLVQPAKEPRHVRLECQVLAIKALPPVRLGESEMLPVVPVLSMCQLPAWQDQKLDSQ